MFIPMKLTIVTMLPLICNNNIHHKPIILSPQKYINISSNLPKNKNIMEYNTMNSRELFSSSIENTFYDSIIEDLGK